MLIFNKYSWHYRLILFTLGEKFFLDTTKIDWRATESQPADTPNFKIIYKSLPKTVNLCPYCRAVVYCLMTLPFVYVWKLFPHKPTKELTHAQIMKRMKRRSFLIRCSAGSFNLALGIWHIFFDQQYFVAAIQISLGLILILLFPFWNIFFKIFRPVGKVISPIVKSIYAMLPKKKQSQEDLLDITEKNPSLFKAKIAAEHDKICPPIYFVDKTNPKEYK